MSIIKYKPNPCTEILLLKGGRSPTFATIFRTYQLPTQTIQCQSHLPRKVLKASKLLNQITKQSTTAKMSKIPFIFLNSKYQNKRINEREK